MKDENPKDRKLLMRKNLWFRCPAKDIQRHLGMKEDKQRGAVDVLMKNGIIKVSRRIGNVLWIRVSGTRLTAMDKWDRDEQDSETGKSRNGEIQEQENPGTGNGEIPELEVRKSRIPSSKNHSEESANNRHSFSSDCANGTFSNEKETSTPQMELANQLQNILIKYLKARSTTSIKGWSRHFLKLLKDYPFKRIKKVLKWFGEKEHFKWRWTPHLNTAKKFQERFEDMERAIVRWNEEQGIEEAPSDIPDWAKNPDGTVKTLGNGTPVYMP